VEVAIGVVMVALAAGAAGWALWARGRSAEAGARLEAETRRADEASGRAEAAENARRLAEDRAARLEEQINSLKREHEGHLAGERRVHEANLRGAEQENQRVLARIENINRQFDSVFGHIAGKALRASTDQFLTLADQTLQPVRQTHAQIERHLTTLETRNQSLNDETSRLARALLRPEIRGGYGEIQLERIAELAGMRAYCDFAMQSSQRDAEGKLLRPDMIVRLPNERVIVVDAKTSLVSYLRALDAQNREEQRQHFDDFARDVADQVKDLSRKGYWAAYDGSPDFVVMFVPGDHFLDAALSRRPELIETAAAGNVIITSPATLIGLLRAVAVGWREHRLAQEARQLLALGAELHDRARVAFEHAAALGAAIGQAVDHYNDFVGSVDLRLMPTLRRFEGAGVKSAKDLPELPQVTAEPRRLLSAEPDMNT
jgi:DNA recombination protein RmuC